ncbi:MAG TPA: hypothetical protein VF757_06745, partial [Sphingomicrobium sp.]
MLHWTRRLLVVAAALSLTGCLWGPGKFASDLTLRKNGTFVLDYRGEMVLQIPNDDPSDKVEVKWQDSMLHCFKDGHVEQDQNVMMEPQPDGSMVRRPWPRKANERPCTAAELSKAKSDFLKAKSEQAASKRRDAEQMAKMFGLPGLDDASNRAFAAKLMKYDGWRSVTYRGNGVFDVVYHAEGRATQDFLFPALPDNDLIVPFIALRRRADGSVLVTAPAFTGGAGPLAARAGAAAAGEMKGPVSRAQGRFTVITDGEILTNNSEDGAAPHPIGRQLHWDVGPSSNKIPETLIR